MDTTRTTPLAGEPDNNWEADTIEALAGPVR